MSSVLDQVGFSGRRRPRDPLLVAVSAYVAGVAVPVTGWSMPKFWKKVPFENMPRWRQEEKLAREMGYDHAAQCRHRLNDILPQGK